MEQSSFQLIQDLNNGIVDLETIYANYEKNIKQHNSKYNALVTIQEDIFEKEFITDLKNQNNNKTLKGLPVVIKDSLLTKGITTTCGVEEYKDYIPENSASCVETILESGGVISGKSNTPAYTLDIQTFNDLHGVTKNPYDVEYTAGGSSGGSAAAIALGMTDLALGSDLAGSLRIPAAYCGISSMKPTYGTTNNYGHIPPEPSSSFAGFEVTIGPMASCVAGLKLLLKILSTNPMGGYPSLEASKSNKISLDDITLKISPMIGGMNVSSGVQIGMDNLIFKLIDQEINYELAEPKLDWNGIYEAHSIFYKNFINSTKPEKSDPSPSELANAIEIRNRESRKLEKFMGDSVWILPVSRLETFKHNYDSNPFEIEGQTFEYWDSIDYTIPLSVLGSPVVVIPTGMVKNLPFGIQIVGKKWKDYDLLEIASQLESIFEDEITPPNV